jgi:very-short-patch-repair endonuclease
VNSDLRRLLVDGHGVAHAPDGVPRHVVHHAHRSGTVQRLHPRTYALGDGRLTRWRAALAYLGPGAALSHSTALCVWGLYDQPAEEPVHVSVPARVHRRHGGDGLIVHRRVALDPVGRHGLPVTRLERSVVDSWPLVEAALRREPVIAAVSGRRTTVPRIREALAAAPRLKDRRTLCTVLDLLEAGCHSPLEMWGLLHVFDDPTLRRQVPIRLSELGRTVYLDVYAEGERVDFELDGARWHASRDDRERDLRRDAALAARGILVVRYTHRRLTTEPEVVRREIREILAARGRGSGAQRSGAAGNYGRAPDGRAT